MIAFPRSSVGTQPEPLRGSGMLDCPCPGLHAEHRNLWGSLLLLAERSFESSETYTLNDFTEPFAL